MVLSLRWRTLKDKGALHMLRAYSLGTAGPPSWDCHFPFCPANDSHGMGIDVYMGSLGSGRILHSQGSKSQGRQHMFVLRCSDFLCVSLCGSRLLILLSLCSWASIFPHNQVWSMLTSFMFICLTLVPVASLCITCFSSSLEGRAGKINFLKNYTTLKIPHSPGLADWRLLETVIQKSNFPNIWFASCFKSCSRNPETRSSASPFARCKY